jgi:glycosyltransferase involved in cell wall biosynthesis
MNQLPRISIVTPSFNQGEYLEQTIDSVLSQNYPHLEYIVIDGGSTDNSTEIIRRYEKHLHYWESQPDRGQSHAINKGFEKCSGDVFNWLNSDDYYYPETLQFVGDFFSDPENRVLAGRSRVFDESGTRYFSRGTDIYDGNMAKTLGQARIDQPETFFRLQLIKDVFPLREDLHYLMDRDMWIRFLLKNGGEGISSVSRPLVHFRLHGDSKTVSQKSDFERERNSYFAGIAVVSKQPEIASLIEEVVGAKPFENVPEIPAPLSKRVIQYFLLQLVAESYMRDRRSEVSKLMGYIQPDLLKENDRKQLREIKFRNQYLPLWFIRLLRRN